MFFVGDGTESTNSLGTVWPCGWTRVVRPNAPASEPGSQGHLFAVGGGLVDDVAAAGRPRHASHGGSAGGARYAGGRAAAGQAGTRTARVEQHRRAEPGTPAVAAADRAGGVR